ncbi:hypothetical protein DI005_20200 [Prauserella sp. PE36]|uniref:hypothetical protein n=1 Tax=Prauserella sp. PE36 TaxID=1504709 RepID=UPI000DE2ED50|nr:hypothetical protein [Prauserella sp. PE36]RBM18117.1 hypothetical protein DI005_20200 [Prauserella sp. PE36]
MSLTALFTEAVPLLAQPPDPAPAPPPGLQGFGNSVISWTKWGLLIAGMVGIIVSAIMIAIGRRNRHQTAYDGLTGVGWGLVALAIGSVAATLVGAFQL